jgi:glycosyltransferase involved in cell wall biosynthesis
VGKPAATVAVVIPAYHPPPSLLVLTAALVPSPLVEAVLVVDDGSGEGFAARFAEVAGLAKVTVLRHPQNRGKGAALKTGLSHAIDALPEVAGIVTADADGQHAPADVLRAAALVAGGDLALHLGVRQVGASAPWRSRFGNSMTRHVLAAVSGMRLSDTQTGLRGIPRACLAELLLLPEDGYDYEMDMILACGRRGWPIREMPVETIYLDGNRTSHFRPLRDSLRIYHVLLRYAGSSLLAALVDNAIFMGAFAATANILGSQVLGRLGSLLFNYRVNRNAVFRSDVPARAAFLKYVALVVVSGAVSYGLIRGLVVAGLGVLAAKITAESLVFFGNFLVQRALIFPSRHKR